jgi:hypothetical protein
MRAYWEGAVLAAAMLTAGGAQAHHSFAAFFNPDKTVSIKGSVVSFAFKNPHGVILLDVPGKDGKVERWAVETNAPVVLQRRGWTRSSIKPGEVVTIDGWPSRDGKPYVRLLKAARADGSVIGVPFGQGDN